MASTTEAHLVQLLLPLRDARENRFAREAFDRVRAELTERFGGVTAYLRAPADGAWDDEGHVEYDRVVLLEVLVDGELDADWWGAYRRTLEARFQQDEVMMRALPARRL